MNRLLALLLFLLPLGLAAQNGGTAYVVPSGGSTNSGSSGSVTGVVSVVFGNGVNGGVSGTTLTISNTASRCTVYLASDTSRIIISGAGTAGANGTYVQQSSTVWTNTAGTHYGIRASTEYELTNAIAEILYSSAVVNGTWTVLDGAPPDATGTYDNLTNCAPFLTPLVYYVETNGNDATSILGDPSRPALTVGHAISNIVSRGTVKIGSGWFPVHPRIMAVEGTAGITMTGVDDVSVIGIPGRSILYSFTNTTATTNLGLGELLCVTNCNRVRFEGVTFKGYMLTNHTLWTNAHGLSGVVYQRCNELVWKNCVFRDHFGQGLNDTGQSQYGLLSTNVLIDGNVFQNIGSQRTNLSIVADGTAICPGAYTVVQNNEIYDCLRGIEAFTSVATVMPGLVIRNNTMVGMIEGGILTGSSTNYVGAVVEGNAIRNPLGYNRRGYPVAAEAYGISWPSRRSRIANNVVEGQWQYGIRMLPPGTDVINEIDIIGNTIQNIVGGAIGAPSGRGLDMGDEGETDTLWSEVLISGNTFRLCSVQAIRLHGTKNVRIVNNNFSDFASASNGVLPAIAIYSANSNVVVQGNIFSDSLFTGQLSAADINSSQKAIKFLDNTCIGLLAPLVDNDAGAELQVRFPPKAVFPTFVANSVTNSQDDTDITLSLGNPFRTNKLHTPFNGHEVTIRDGTSTITTNIILWPTTGVISGGLTNMSTNFASVTVRGNGTNWQYRAVYP